MESEVKLSYCPFPPLPKYNSFINKILFTYKISYQELHNLYFVGSFNEIKKKNKRKCSNLLYEAIDFVFFLISSFLLERQT